jgi:predicted O-methyltransferase YrrM
MNNLMKIKKIIIDIILSFLLIPASFLFLIYKKRGPKNAPMATRIIKKIGIFPIIDHYYDPQFKFSSKEIKSLNANRKLLAIDFNINKQLNFLKTLTFKNELIALNLLNDSNKSDFYINNGSFEAGDADFYYQIIRHFKPKKIIEIGSGHSTKLALIAINKNIEESKINTKIISIEPYENRWLENLNIKVLRKKIENVNFDWHKQLSKNDILFIDSSHVIRPNGDILKIYLEIIPQLKSGVIIQIHDIFTPKNYLNSWLLEDVRLWNEQYILEALLINNSKIEIISALNFLKNNYFNNLKNCCPYLTNDKEPASIYLRIT